MQYTYDFNYSMHFDSMPTHTEQIQDKQFSLAAKELIEADAFQGQEMKQFLNLLVRQGIFVKMGETLLELSEIELELVPRTLEKMERLEGLREQLCGCLKEMNIVLGREREYYINVIILIATLVLTSRLTENHQREIQKWVIFHLIHWQLKGQHSTNAFYEKISSDLLIQSRVKAYIDGSFRRQNHSLKESQTFKQLQSSIQLMKTRQSTSGFALALNKQNKNLHNKAMMNTISFKKQTAQVVQGQRKGLFERGIKK